MKVLRFTLLSVLVLAATVARPEEPKVDAATMDVLEKYIAAIGGREAWAAIHTVRIVNDIAAFGTHRTTERIEDRDTGRFHQIARSGDGVTEIGFDGSRVWQRASFFRGYLNDSDPQARGARRGQRNVLLTYREDNTPFRRIADETVSGKSYVVLSGAERDPLGRDVEVKYYFDPTTHLLRRIVRGTAVTASTELDDYRTVSGVRVPFTTRSIQPQVTLETHLREWQANIPIPAGTFSFDGKDSARDPSQSAPAAEATAAPAKAESMRSFGENDDIPEGLRLETFELAWSKINDSYPDPKFGGVDWQKVHDEFLPRAKTTVKSGPFHLLLSEMIGRLGKSHFRITPPDRTVLASTRDLSSLKNGSVGIGLRLLDEQLVVYDLESGYPAAAAAVKKGWVLAKVNGKTPAELYAEHRAEDRGFELRPEIARVRAVTAKINGKAGEAVELDFLDEHDQPRHVMLTRKEIPLQRATDVEFEAKVLPGNTGYIKFRIFAGDVLTKFEAAMKTLHDTTSLIVDLRGNPGGVGDLAPSIAALLSPSEGSLGTSQFRYSTRRFDYKPAAAPYLGKVFLLVDAWSGSTSEVFAAGLQEQKRVTVVGGTSAGAVLPSLVQQLPTGGAMQYVVSDFRTPNGRLLEGSGVRPDVEAHVTRQALIEGADPVLDRALALAKAKD